MATVWNVTARVRDDDGESSRISFFLDGATAVASVETAAESILEAADVLIDGVIESVSASLEIDTTGWTLKTTKGTSDRLVGGRFIWNAANGQNPIVNLPTFKKDDYVPAGSENIDIADAAVVAFLAAFTGAATTSGVGSEILTLNQAYETFGGKK